MDVTISSSIVDGFKVCNASNCTISEGICEFKNCGGCRIASYCSKKCQIHDWKSHKAACKAFRESNLAPERKKFGKALIQWATKYEDTLLWFYHTHKNNRVGEKRALYLQANMSAHKFLSVDIIFENDLGTRAPMSAKVLQDCGDDVLIIGVDETEMSTYYILSNRECQMSPIHNIVSGNNGATRLCFKKDHFP